MAHRAGVGIGTVYRHFPSSQALTEGLVEHRFLEMADAARSAGADPDGFGAIRKFIAQSLQVYIDDPDFAAVVLASTAARDETRTLRADLLAAFSVLVARTSSQHFRDDLEPADIMILLGGVGYAARLRPGRAAVYLDALFDGIVA